MRRAGLFALAVFFLPVATHAAIVINEIAWMGTVVSANDEWIELANTGSTSVDLTGWQLTSSSGSPTITLSGSIAAGSYFLLERSSDDTVPSSTADQIYTGSLPNTGVTLTLTDAGAGVIDTVSGGTNWTDIGGDNSTKDTPQRVGSGWQTATPTPRAGNVGSGNTSNPPDSSESSASSGSGAGSGSSPAPPSSLSIDIGSNKKAFLHVPLRFMASLKPKSTEGEGVRVFWSFGDGSSTEGREVEKTYRYPGTYVVSARGIGGVISAQDDVVVTVRSAQVSVTGSSLEGIRIANADSERIDLSGWQIASSDGSFRIPDGTWVLPESEVLFPAEVTRLSFAFSATLAYPNGIIASTFPAAGVATAPQPVAAVASSHKEQTVESVTVRSVTNETTPDTYATHITAPAATTQLAAAGAPLLAEEEPENEDSRSFVGELLHSPWTLGFIGLVAIAGAALMIL